MTDTTTSTFECHCDKCPKALARAKEVLAYLDRSDVRQLFPKGHCGSQPELAELDERLAQHIAFIDSITPGAEYDIEDAKALKKDLEVIKDIASIGITVDLLVGTVLAAHDVKAESNNPFEALERLLVSGPPASFTEGIERLRPLTEAYRESSRIVDHLASTEEERFERALSRIDQLIGRGNPFGGSSNPFADLAGENPFGDSDNPFAAIFGGRDEEVDPAVKAAVDDALPEGTPEEVAERVAEIVGKALSARGVSIDDVVLKAEEADSTELPEGLLPPGIGAELASLKISITSKQQDDVSGFGGMGFGSETEEAGTEEDRDSRFHC